MQLEEAQALLEQHGQRHVLRFWDRLDHDGQTRLLSQVETLDWASIDSMRTLLKEKGRAAATEDIEPADVERCAGAERVQAILGGEAALAAGKVGVLLVAGGQGSRLGFDGPKGAFSIGPISHASLYEIHARKVLALERKYGSTVPFYIMTSRSNDSPTRDFFKTQNYFGLSEEHVRFFVQGMWPALFEDGTIVLDRPDRVFVSPDGHGGILTALRVNGMLDDMAKRGLETLFFFQVDNPLVEIADPAFIGLHRMRKADVSVKVCAKRGPEEGLGVVVKRGGRHAVVEYTELTHEQKHAVLPGGGPLRFQFGSVAIHVFSFDFLSREAKAQLPVHLAHKKVPFCDEQGATREADRPNAYKFEKFIFDVIPRAGRALNVEFAREDEFSPVKNASGSDSPDTARRDMMRKHARWFEACGVKVAYREDGQPVHRIEIDPCFALGPDDLRRRLAMGFEIKGDVILK